VMMDTFAPATLSRVRDVQVVRLGSEWVVDGTRHQAVFVEVRAQDASYWVYFEGLAGQDVAGFADAALATLDALPASSSRGPGEALTWLVRGLIAAVVLAVVGIWAGHRRHRDREPRHLWPR
jgi:uncharacterized membrane protein